MHNKLMVNIAFCSLLTAHITMTMDLSTLQQVKDCQEKANIIIQAMREKKDKDELVPHTNPLGLQSGRISNSYSSNPTHVSPSIKTDYILNNGHFTTTPNLEKECYTLVKGTSCGDLRYKFTCEDKNGNRKKVICQATNDDKSQIINATHVQMKEYDNHGNLHEYVIDLNKLERVKPIEQYDVTIVDLIPSDLGDSVMFSYEKDGIIHFPEILLKNLPNEEKQITHETEDGQEIILNLPQNLYEQLNLQRETYKQLNTSATLAVLAKEKKSWRGLFVSAPALNITCYQGTSISLDHILHLDGINSEIVNIDPSDNYVYIITYANVDGQISAVKVNSSKELQPIHNYILIKNSNDENDSFMIQLPEQKNELTEGKIKPTSLDNTEELSTTSTMTPRTTKNFQTLNSYAKCTKTVLGIGAFSAIIIAILYQYNKLPQAFINALNKIGILHAQ